jgi:hypothetical protein
MFEWPFLYLNTYVTDVPQYIELDIQQTGTYINFDFWNYMGKAPEFELCEIEIYGEF